MRDPYRGQTVDENQFLRSFVRPFSFRNMFDDNAFSAMPSFFAFDPTVFATNYSSNFRSFDDDILTRIMEMTARQ